MTRTSRISPSRARQDERGFGLIELAIALSVLAIGILGMAALAPMGTKSVAKSGEVTRASELASQAAERLLATPYGDPDLANGPHVSPSNPEPGDYHLSWVVEDDQPIPQCKRITVSVRWPQANSPNRAQLVIVSPRANDQ